MKQWRKGVPPRTCSELPVMRPEALKGYSKACHKCCQVPAEALSIADHICQRQRHDWVETGLIQHLQALT